jgi:molecular chaperone GrpE
MELIYQRLYNSLKKLGLEPLESEGYKFDPHVHHAVEMVPSEEVEDHTVVQELQRGYNFRGRLLRPAMVRVAVRP